jgi:2-oxoglutarate ferredoxin oxidoreductase subunit delta
MKILISGEGGQGVQKLSQIISDSAYKENYIVSYMPHYGVEMRMGISFAFIIIEKNENISYPKFSKADMLVAMTNREIQITEEFIDKNTRVINLINANDYLKKHNLSSRSLNMLALGIVVKELNTSKMRLDKIKIKNEIIEKLGSKKELQNDNIKAFELGLTTENEVYSHSLKDVTKIVKKPLIDKDSQKTHIRFPNLCKSCALCVEKCPVSALSMNAKETNYFDKPMPNVDIKKCTACLICQNICPDSAIKINKKN